MTSLLLHPITNHQLEAVIQNTPHSVMISGPEGAGKRALALDIAKRVLGIGNPAENAAVLYIVPEKGHIAIDEVRKLRSFLSRKTTGTNAIRRMIVLIDAHTMGTDSQNALLKTLEEPPSDTMLLLTTSDITALKPTIRSRAQHMAIQPVTLEEATNYFTKQKHSESSIKTAYFLSNGHVGLLHALLNDETEHPMVQAITEAKRLLTASKYERLAEVDALSKQKDLLEPLLDGLQRVVTGGLRQSAATDNKTQAKRFYTLSSLVMTAQSQLKQSVNPKLLLTHLFLEM